MKSSFCRHLKAVVCICLFPGQVTLAQSSPHLATREVVHCLRVLEQPTLDNAVLAAKQLRALAATQQGAAKAATEKLATEVRNLFYSELVLINARGGVPAAEQKARDKEKSAAAWLKPNALGTINRVAYKNEMEQAGRIREDARNAHAMAKQELQQVVDRTKSALTAYKSSGQVEVGNILEQAARAILMRSLSSGELMAMAEATAEVEPPTKIDPALVGPMIVCGLILLGILLRRLHPAPRDTW